MKCSCGGKTRVEDTRSNDYTVYRFRKCIVCGKAFVTQESKIDFATGRRLMNKISNARYRPEKPVKKKPRRRRLE